MSKGTVHVTFKPRMHVELARNLLTFDLKLDVQNDYDMACKRSFNMLNILLAILDYSANFHQIFACCFHQKSFNFNNFHLIAYTL